MGLKKISRRISQDHKVAIKRFETQRRKNILAVPGPNTFIIILDHLKPRFNIGKIFRSADAFGAHGVHLIGTDFFDPAPGMGSFKWVPAKFFDDFDSCHHQLAKDGYDFFRLDPEAGHPLPQIQFPARSAFIFGHEEFGFSFDLKKFPDIRSVSIPQFGHVQSLNVSVAASMTMYEYVRQHATI
jgi:tRNA G18 (ribose-2'-O)-methylase SpoU